MAYKKPTKADIEARCRQYISDSKLHTIVRDQKDRAEKYQDYFRGGTHQWTEEEWNIYQSRGVNPITINRCKPVLKGLLGMYLQSRQDVRVRPRRGGTATVSQVHTELLKHTQDNSYADYVYCQVFLRGGIDTESYLLLRIDRGENPNGQPEIEARSLWQISVDRNATEYDLNKSCKYIIDRRWQDQDEIEATYPDMAETIKRALNEMDELGERPVERLATYMTTDADVDSYQEDEGEQIPDTDLLKKYRYLLHHVYWKEIIPGLVVHDKQEQKMTVLTDQKKISKLRRKGKKSKRFVIVNYPVKKLHETVILGNHMLEDVLEPLGEGVTAYPIVRFSPIWDDGFACGALDDVIDLNKEENIHRTQTIRILNQTANSGFFVGSDANKEYTAILKNFGAVPGIVIPKDKFGGYVEKITPNPLPKGHFVLGQQFEQDIKRTSGIDDASQGYETGKSESGRAINLKLLANRSSNELMFDNFYRSLEIFGNLLLDVQLANDHYTDEEIKAIISESSLLDAKLLAQAHHRFTAQLGGADLPQPMPLPPIDGSVVREEDRLQVLDMVQRGSEAAGQYAKAYPQLLATWEQVIRVEAIRMLLTKLREDKGKYGVKVVVSDSAPTERMAQMIQMDALMRNYGGIIPPDIFIELTDLPQKEEIKMRLRQAQAAQPAAAGQGGMAA